MERQLKDGGAAGQSHVSLVPFAVSPTDIVNMIVGIGLPTVEIALAASSAKLAHFTGNQWDENWVWDRTALDKLPVGTLIALLTGLRETVTVQ